MYKHLVIIGGGASGIFCAVNAAAQSKGLKVTVLEKTHRLLSKVLVSGGGRCNLTHDCASIDEMSACYPRGRHFVRKAFHQFFTEQTREWFRVRGVDTVPESDGRVFPRSNKSESVIQCLLTEVERYHVNIRYKSEVVSITKGDDNFQIQLADGGSLRADFVFIACGGFSKPASFDWIKALGHDIVSPVPSLFTFNLPGHSITALMGVSVPVVGLKINGFSFRSRGPLLVTHWGLSGPAILRLSALAARELADRDYVFRVVADWLPDMSRDEIIEEFECFRHEKGSLMVQSRPMNMIPSRLWHFLAETAGIGKNVRWADLSGQQRNSLAEVLKGQVFDVKGKTTFKEEFVTAGGVSTRQVDPSTMQSRVLDGLYFGGEVLDVDGITGGYNFQHAWSSAWIAAKHISGRIS
jgi:predicted Rossmann fold flavoprotein